MALRNHSISLLSSLHLANDKVPSIESLRQLTSDAHETPEEVVLCLELTRA
jgi:hypothetical protein